MEKIYGYEDACNMLCKLEDFKAGDIFYMIGRDNTVSQCEIMRRVVIEKTRTQTLDLFYVETSRIRDGIYASTDEWRLNSDDLMFHSIDDIGIFYSCKIIVIGELMSRCIDNLKKLLEDDDLVLAQAEMYNIETAIKNSIKAKAILASINDEINNK